MERKISLNGNWNLYFVDEINLPKNTIENYQKLKKITATVPGNVELDMSKAGLLDKDLFKGMATVNSMECEKYGFWYETKFDTPKYNNEERVFIRFGAVDCIADYYINGKKAYSSKNAFIPQEFDATDYLKTDSQNILAVHITPALLGELEYEYAGSMFCTSSALLFSLRKPAHAYGWDIFPRAVTAGLWRDVDIVIKNQYSFENVHYKAYLKDNGKSAQVKFFISVNAPVCELMKSGGLTLKIKGVCKDSAFNAETRLERVKAAKPTVLIENPKIWWPRGYGEANIYDTTIGLYNGDTLVEEVRLNVGIRELQLDRTDTIKCEKPRFHFIVNGKEIFCKGSNWVPMDAYHSRDKQRYARALELATDIGCNMLRVWGGGVYEDKEFYDYCDRNGILVWQDFMMACQKLNINEEIKENLRNEFKTVIKTLRTHPCLALYSGDNEVDALSLRMNINPDTNIVTREILPQVIQEHDPFTPYVASSPYISGKLVTERGQCEEILPEQHLWGARDYYKADFYKNSKACFVGETGYHGCPDVQSVKEIVDEEYVWPIYNEQWTLHSSDQFGSQHRVKLMDDQIAQLFGIRMDNIEDFAFASQISQAEAKKYFIERVRIKRPYTGGILWWNLIDGWPQMSDAVVDYFYRKKVAYDYIKRSQAPIILMLDEMRNWHFPLIASNDTLMDESGEYEITDIENGEVILKGEFVAKANTSTEIAKVNLLYSTQKMLLIKWTIGGKEYYNHYLAGMPPFDFDTYKKWYKKLNEITEEK